MTTLLDFVLAASVLLIVLTGWCVGIWHTVHHFRRKHRLEQESDDRAHKKALAEDYAEVTKQLSEGTVNFSDYLGQRSAEAKRDTESLRLEKKGQ
jgi:hypothetical protein